VGHVVRLAAAAQEEHMSGLPERQQGRAACAGSAFTRSGSAAASHCGSMRYLSMTMELQSCCGVGAGACVHVRGASTRGALQMDVADSKGSSKPAK